MSLRDEGNGRANFSRVALLKPSPLILKTAIHDVALRCNRDNFRSQQRQLQIATETTSDKALALQVLIGLPVVDIALIVLKLLLNLLLEASLLPLLK